METMRIVCEAAGLGARDFEAEPALMEANYGDWEGLTLMEIGERFPEAAQAREAEKWSYAPPQGESYSMLADRVSNWLRGLAGPTLVVAHGGVLRALMHLLGGLPHHDAPHLAVPQDRAILFTQRAVLTI
jgi:probable phosphoglycerate mutase